MVINQLALRHSPARSGALIRVTVAATLLLSGCAGFMGHRDRGVETGSSEPVTSAPAAPEPQVTATEAAVAAQPQGTADTQPTVISPAINPTAPRTYTVRRGDTLWDLSSKFLRDPWLWPEIWHANPQVKNPHLIYPGDVLALVYGADGKPALQLLQGGAARLNPALRSSPLDGAIATIPYSAIEAFLQRPSVLSKEQLKIAPRVIAIRDDHEIGAVGHEVYVQGLNRSTAPASRFNVVHVEDELRDPDDHSLLGYQGVYTATAMVANVGSAGKDGYGKQGPAKVVLQDTVRETLRGDRLIANDTDVPLNFVPRAPSRRINGRIISVVDGVELIGQYHIVVINRGRRHGIETGHVLAIDQAGETIRDVSAAASFAGMKVGSSLAPRVKLPNERAGTLLVFKTYDRMSYALVVEATHAIRIADVVRTP